MSCTISNIDFIQNALLCAVLWDVVLTTQEAVHEATALFLNVLSQVSHLLLSQMYSVFLHNSFTCNNNNYVTAGGGLWGIHEWILDLIDPIRVQPESVIMKVVSVYP